MYSVAFQFFAQPLVEFEEDERLLECDVTESSRDDDRQQMEQRYHELLDQNKTEFHKSSGMLQKIFTDLANALTGLKKLSDKDVQPYRISG